MTEFRDIKGYEGEYQITNDGRVYSLPRRNVNFVGGGKFRKLQKHSNGYISINLRKCDMFLVHRLVATAFLANPDNLEFVNHKNGIKTDNRVENLEWCTRQYNEDHAYSTGLKNSTGSFNVMAKLDELQVREIKRSPLNAYELAKQFNVHRMTIERILNNKTWQHVA